MKIHNSFLHENYSETVRQKAIFSRLWFWKQQYILCIIRMSTLHSLSPSVCVSWKWSFPWIFPAISHSRISLFLAIFFFVMQKKLARKFYEWREKNSAWEDFQLPYCSAFPSFSSWIYLFISIKSSIVFKCTKCYKMKSHRKSQGNGSIFRVDKKKWWRLSSKSNCTNERRSKKKMYCNQS